MIDIQKCFTDQASEGSDEDLHKEIVQVKKEELLREVLQQKKDIEKKRAHRTCQVRSRLLSEKHSYLIIVRL